ncbi:MAG TPA: M20/M25/M40 family metallo-hydrolase [Planctomycetota bacterium]|nr:M20/M25/M40 family metallo-hydrolase [Planctomycetota bacterium]
MSRLEPIHDRLSASIRRDRLVETALKLIAVPSRTGEAGEACDALAGLLERDGFKVERPAAGHPAAPAVVARWTSGRPGPTLQFNGHLDTVHLPYVPAAHAGGRLTGSGAADMKGGLAAAVEAFRALRDADALPRGSVLLTAHDLHEAPWGFGEQLDGLIRDGIVGDAVLIPEPLSDRLPVIGRGAAVWTITARRGGAPIHEVMRPADEPDVIAVGARLVERLGRLDARLSAKSDALAGRESVFIGQIHAGEIYNQFPKECRLEGTRRWLPGTRREDVEAELRSVAADLQAETGTAIDMDVRWIRDAYFLDPDCALAVAFEDALRIAGCAPLPRGPKPFVDDGNSFWGLARVPAITHGPLAAGQHTLEEWVSVDDLVRVARVYAFTAAVFCSGGESLR